LRCCRTCTPACCLCMYRTHKTCSRCDLSMFACLLCCCCLQYHYRPGTVSGWLAHQLDDYSQRRRSEQLFTTPSLAHVRCCSGSVAHPACSSSDAMRRCQRVVWQPGSNKRSCMCAICAGITGAVYACKLWMHLPLAPCIALCTCSPAQHTGAAALIGSA
jgi:hypothetical protein